MRPTFYHYPPKSIINVQMCIWGKMMPKRGLLEYPTKISLKALTLLASEDDHVFVALVFPYMGID